jgi:hypothetical protein
MRKSEFKFKFKSKKTIEKSKREGGKIIQKTKKNRQRMKKRLKFEKGRKIEERKRGLF